MILVCGSLTDIVTELMCARLQKLGREYRLLDLDVYPARYVVRWTWDEGHVAGSIAGPDWFLPLEEIGGVFVRYVGTGGGTTLLPDTLEEGAAIERQAGLMSLWEHLPCPVANRLGGALSNHSKPYQALVIRETALRVPRTLITSDPVAARAFYEECAGRVIFKSVSGIRSIVRRMESSDLDRLAHLRNGPAQFQAYVPGDDVRVHTVGRDVFATLVRSEAVDYRYAEHQGATVEMEPTVLPLTVAEACVDLARAMNLSVAGTDLKRTPEGEWYCFEVNPSPGFAYYEQHTGQPISEALADLLSQRSTIPAKGGDRSA
jgi:hypothetical protein